MTIAIVFQKKILTFANQERHLKQNCHYPSSTRMTATLTYTLVLAAIYFGIKAIEYVEHREH